MTTLSRDVVDADRRLEQGSEKAAEALAAHRWHWTLDESNPERVSFRAYAREVGRSDRSIGNMARGYADWTSANGSVRTLSEAIERAKLSGEKEAAVEAVAEARGVAFTTAARTGEHRREAQSVLETARDRAERKGTTVEEEIPAVADFRVKASTSRARTERQRKERSSFRFIEIEGHFAAAKRRLTEALNAAADVDYNDEELELLTSTLANLRALLGLIDLRLAGSTDVDWDAELAALSEKGDAK